MRILAVGDVVGTSGCIMMRDFLRTIKKEKQIDFCVVNAENASNGKGITRSLAYELLDYGADVLTMGNHTFSKLADMSKLFEENANILRPANYPPGTMGVGYKIFHANGVPIAVANVLGRVYLAQLDCPFRAMDAIIEEIGTQAAVILVDFHAEVTSEKVAMGWYLDGRVSAVWGTHTHVLTADERVLPNGTAYITDIGMTGPRNGILGVKKEIILKRFVQAQHDKFELDENGRTQLNAVVIEVDELNGKAKKIERLTIFE
ncbi:MAG: TIGR00282 family metallophosphoesterase [Hyphomonadaceae bacterium]|nr:TIGR00282 family metallophosphoesterase [Clostridia bacterium]